jgi:hypothetical protein
LLSRNILNSQENGVFENLSQIIPQIKVKQIGKLDKSLKRAFCMNKMNLTVQV